MSATPEVDVRRQEAWSDQAWWEGQIDQAITTPDPVLANLRITLAHYRLSLALRAVLGPDTGANFHTWATWGSKKAGVTIRQEDAPPLRRLTLLAGGGMGLLGAVGTWRLLRAPRLFATTAGALLGAWTLQALTQRLRDRAGRLILGGNITVLDDIGRATGRFVSTFAAHPTPEPRRLADFLGTLRPGPSTAGGQTLLRQAFTCYHQARHAPDRNARHEQMLLGNLYAILHEHFRLQPYIAGAMPLLGRRLITQWLLDFTVGQRTMRVSQDVVPLAAGAGFDPLQVLENTELREFLSGPGGWDRTPNTVRGSRAANWADLHDRMNFICDLFRTGHGDPGLFSAPYSAAQRAAIEAGRIPHGPL
jgi:hypothetical protein